ncbi:MAG: twin-arginine translocase TatA/TatE family subunit [Bacteroidetes bacterium]|nr:twin-arginine translocase TatA/TatE family subunit [Bacteroidota bacterium]
MLLFLNDVAGSEILLILAFILIFFGSKSIPGIARTMGRTIRQIKDATQEVQNEISKSGANIKKDMNLRSFVDDTIKDIQQPLDQYTDEVNESLKPDSTPYQKTKIPTFPSPTSEHPEVTAKKAVQAENLKKEEDITPEKE